MFRNILLRSLALFSALGIIWAAAPASAQSIQCGSTYQVRSGDNLSKIAQQAYGNQGLAQYLYDVNWRVLGDDPSELRPGQSLTVPCLPDGPERVREIVDRPIETEISTLRRPDDVIAFLTAKDFAPFTDTKYPEGGMLAKVVKEITSEPLDGRGSEVYWVNDWSSHLNMLLLQRNAFDAGFPWYKPDCNEPETLDDNGKFRCDSFYFSDPLYKVVVPFYARSDNPLDPRTADDMRGQTVCRPKGYFTFDLAQKGLIDPSGNGGNDLITLVKADTPTDCFRQLMDGRVNFVTINAATAASPIRDLGISAEIVERDGLSSLETLHIVVPKELPQAEVLLFEINKRLRALKESGEYNEIARRYLEIYHGEDS